MSGGRPAVAERACRLKTQVAKQRIVWLSGNQACSLFRSGGTRNFQPVGAQAFLKQRPDAFFVIQNQNSDSLQYDGRRPRRITGAAVGVAFPDDWLGQ